MGDPSGGSDSVMDPAAGPPTSGPDGADGVVGDMARQQAAVATLGIAALREATLETLFVQGVELVAETLGLELSKVLELQPDGANLLLRAGVGWRPGGIGKAIVDADAGSQAGYTLLADVPVVVADLRRETRFQAPPLLIEHRAVSGISTVIYGRERPWGTLSGHSRQPREFRRDEVDFVQSVANILGAAIERQRVDDARHEATAMVGRLVEAAPLALILFDSDGQVRVWSRGAELLLGWSADEVVGTTPTLSKHGEDPPPDELLRRVLAGETIADLRFRSFHKDGSRLHLALHAAPVRDGRGAIVGVMAALVDLTEHSHLEARLADARRDHDLLAASVGQLRTLDTPEATAGRICHEVIRWDGFEGAALYALTGERRLVPIGIASSRAVPIRIGQPLPAARTRYLLSRATTGPWVEEFGVRQATSAIDRAWNQAGLRLAAYAPIRREGQIIGILAGGTTAPIGVSRLTYRLPVLNDYASVATAILGDDLVRRQADTRHIDKMRAMIRKRRFRSLYQPIVDLESRRPVGYEALTRFDDGRSPPQAFSDADAIGLLHELEMACIVEALRNADRLPRSAWLSLNASPGLVLASAGLAEALQATDRSAVIEITEHGVVEDYATLNAALRRLPFGTRVAIDDAGTGHSGLHRILELLPDFVKLDISLIRAIDVDLAPQAMVAGLVHFAAEVGCTLIAEGVESEEQLTILRKLGVTHGQGYLFGPPAPIEDLEQS